MDGLMDASKTLLAAPSADFPRGPAAGKPLPRRWTTVAVLLLACLIPRCFVACYSDLLWCDSLHYIHASEALERSDFEVGFKEFGLNLYPILLIPLRHMGLDWQITGKFFGVLVASCTVLPLWGWLRRMFDDRLAVTACLVYAMQGKLIAISPLIIRDSTFWFLLVLALYYQWRAMGELRMRLFFATGIAMTLAVYTRTEGWLLVVPLAGWAACRWARAKGQRVRTALGAALCVAVVPAIVALVNLTWLREHPQWEFLRPSHVRLAVRWWNSASGMQVPIPFQEHPADSPAAGWDQRALASAGPSPHLPFSPSPHLPISRSPHLPTGGPAVAGAPLSHPASGQQPPLSSIHVPAVPTAEQSIPGWMLSYKLLERLAKACTWVGSILLLAGLAYGWRTFRRPEHLAIFAMNMLLVFVARIRYGTVVGLDLRYFMPIVITGVPWMALGLTRLIGGAVSLCGRRRLLSPRASRLLAGSLIAAATLCSFIDGPMSAAAYMRKHSDLGRWIYSHVGHDCSLAGNIDHFSLETFSSRGLVISTFSPSECMLVPMPQAAARQEADVVVLWTEECISPEYREIITSQHRGIIAQRLTAYCGYRQVDAKELPAGENELLVFVRPDRAGNPSGKTELRLANQSTDPSAK
jgi:hypothetical protein